jgi:hypothetical protein
MLTRFDDYLIHQTPETLDHVVSGDRNFYDRYYFNCHDLTGDTFLVVAMGAYPNLNIIDAFATVVVRNQRQYVVKASRVLDGDRSNSVVGPIGVEILDGLRKLRVWCDQNDWNLSFDLTFEGAIAAFQEPHFKRYAGPRVVMDYTRLTQTGRWSGELTVGGERHAVEQATWWGGRDHSWGIRPIGEPERGGAPARDGNMGFFWNWSPVQFSDHSIMYTISENHDGSRWHEAGARLFGIDANKSPEPLGIVRHDLKLKPGTRIFDGGTVVLREPDGRETSLLFEPLSLLGMAGAGYAYGEGMWRHAQYHGPLAVDGEVWDVTDPVVVAKIAPQNETVCRVTENGKTGYGIFEFILFGLYEPYGFQQLSDVAH